MSSSRPHRRASAQEDELEWPTDPHSEQIVFGNAIRDWPALRDRIGPGLFGNRDYQRILGVMIAIGERTEPVDRNTIARELERTGALQDNDLARLVDADEADLIGRAAVVEYVDLPEIEEINGIDDLHNLWGPDKTLEHIEQALLRKPSVWGAFRLRDDGVFFIDFDPDTDPIFIYGLLVIIAATRSASSENWGRLLEWLDADGKQHRWAMPIDLLTTIPILYLPLHGEGSRMKRPFKQKGESRPAIFRQVEAGLYAIHVQYTRRFHPTEASRIVPSPRLLAVRLRSDFLLSLSSPN